MKQNANTNSQLKEEMDFRLSLLRLMTVPHGGATPGVQPGAESPSKTMEELSGVLVASPKPVRRARSAA